MVDSMITWIMFLFGFRYITRLSKANDPALTLINNRFQMKHSYKFIFELNVRKTFYDCIYKSLRWCYTSFHIRNKNTYKNRKGIQEWKKQWTQGQTLKWAKYAKCTNVTNALNMTNVTNKTNVTKLYRHQTLQLI